MMPWDTENRGPMPRHLQPGDPNYDRPLGMDSKGRSKEPSETEQKQLLTEQLVGLMGDVILLANTRRPDAFVPMFDVLVVTEE